MRRTVIVLAVLASLSGCAAGRSYSAAPVLEAPRAAPAPLDRSLFAQRGSSGLTEEDLGRILDAPLGLRFPARVGVAALGQSFQPGAPTCIDVGLEASRALGEVLEGSELVEIASEVATEIPTGGGVEGLRELAARYRAPYLLLYTERFEDRTSANGLAALWVTILGGLLTPSQTLRGEGLLAASLLDVRTGTILFTVQERVSFEQKHLPIGAAGAYRDLQRKAADAAAKALAERVLGKLQRLAKAAGAAPVLAMPAAG